MFLRLGRVCRFLMMVDFPEPGKPYRPMIIGFALSVLWTDSVTRDVAQVLEPPEGTAMTTIDYRVLFWVENVYQMVEIWTRCVNSEAIA